jgi:MoaA/NifB/PqqE/SkfB family radical SAM enzyme
MRALVRQVLDFCLRNTRCQVAPREWMVETTNRCNLACPMCTRHSVRFRPEDMGFGFFQTLVRGHPEVEAIWPYGFGEPLLHTEIYDFIRYARLHNKTVSLSTNATLLDEERANQLLDSGLDYLILPVDGVSDETYGQNRYPAQLSEVEARIDQFLKKKLARKSLLHVTVQMIRMKNNAGDVHAFRKKWRRPGVDSVRVRDDLSGLSGISQKRAQREHRPCFFLWRGPLFVQASGKMIPCPYYHGAEPFGDLKRQTALEAWNSEPMTNLRQAHVRGDVSKYPICARCPRYQPHPVLACVSFIVSTHHIRRFFPRLEDIQRLFGWKLFE